MLNITGRWFDEKLDEAFSIRPSEFLFSRDDATVQFCIYLYIASLRAVQKVELIRHHARVEALATQLCLLKLESSCMTQRSSHFEDRT